MFYGKKNISNNNWITKGIKISSKKFKDLYILNSVHAIDPQYYSNYKRIYRRVVRQAKRLNFENIMEHSSNKSKTAWNIINSVTQRSRPHKPYEIQINNEIITDNDKIANSFNSHFVNLPKALQNTNNTLPFDDTKNSTSFSRKSIFLTPTNTFEITETIKDLKSTNSVGPDDISVRIVKQSSEHIAEILAHIVNESFSSGIFPDLLKIAKIVPIFKKGNANNISNFRPIALLSVFSKIIEKILAKRLLSFLKSENILSPHQYGFLEGKSTTSALLKILNYIYQNIDQNNEVIAIFIDLTKAFDCVDHKILLETLENFGIRGTCNNLLKSYLWNRKQFVQCFDKHSEVLSVDIGVPQGSILGPLLFILYINEIQNNIQSFHAAFADDITIITNDKNFEGSLHKLYFNFKKLLYFFDRKKLIFNQEKTVLMQFYSMSHLYNKSIYFTHRQKTIRQVECVRLLGLHIDYSLTWKEQVSAVCAKCSKGCYAIKRLQQITSTGTAKIYYHSNFESHLRYGIIFWGNSTSSKRVFILQKRAIRNMFNLKFRQSCKSTFISNNILTFPCLYIFETLKFVRMNLDDFLRQDTHHNYNTRFGYNLQHNMHRLALYESNPYYMGTILYNQLDLRIRQLPTLNQYLASLKRFLHQNAFYSVEEFLNH